LKSSALKKYFKIPDLPVEEAQPPLKIANPFKFLIEVYFIFIVFNFFL
jgi:hypothetical protein